MEGAVEAFETERSDNDQQRAAIRAAIEALEAEIRTAEDAAKEARTGKPAGNERKDVTHMETAETRTRFFGLTIQERDAFIQREDVQAFLTRVREMKGQNRSVTGAELGIPTVMLDLLRENIGRYSKLISRVRYKPSRAKPGRTSPAPCPRRFGRSPWPTSTSWSCPSPRWRWTATRWAAIWPSPTAPWRMTTT